MVIKSPVKGKLTVTDSELSLDLKGTGYMPSRMYMKRETQILYYGEGGGINLKVIDPVSIGIFMHNICGGEFEKESNALYRLLLKFKSK